ncbi:MAG: hypothetical protein KTR31_37795 [Myxococcales bacterium]|nr:hypothetical protein [Myxococcales bacterium]
MTTTTTSLTTWRAVFAAAAVWTTLGAVPGLLDPGRMLALFHGVEPESPLVLLMYRGSAGQTFLFAIGYLLAALAPRRHAAIVALGGMGKVFYSVRLLMELAQGHGGSLALIAVVGDLIFVTLFAVFFATSGVLHGFLRDPAPATEGA